MANELANIEIKDVSYKTFDGETVTLGEAAVRNITNNNQYITKGEIELFIETAKFRRLNPFLGQLYLVKYDGSKPAQTVVAKAAMLIIAEEHPAYDGMEHGLIVKTRNGEIIDRIGCISYDGETVVGAWAKIYRKDRSKPFEERVDIKEYSKGQSTWKSMPMTMIDKCAQAKALRTAFPKQLGGLYIAEEFSEEINQNYIPQFTEGSTSVDTVGDTVYDITEDIIEEPKKVVEQPKAEQKQEPRPEPQNEEKKIWWVSKEYYEEHKDKLVDLNQWNEETCRMAVSKKGA